MTETIDLRGVTKEEIETLHRRTEVLGVDALITEAEADEVAEAKVATILAMITTTSPPTLLHMTPLAMAPAATMKTPHTPNTASPTPT